jgi:tRNA (cmo5U34)-methyltransferase
MEEFGDTVHYVGCDVSRPMLEICRERFAAPLPGGRHGRTRVRSAARVSGGPGLVIFSVLTLQFTPIEYRRRIVEAAYEHLVDDGAFILVEKLVGRSARLDRMLDGIYLRFKAQNGYSQEEIARKKLSLEGVLVPLDAGQNRAMLLESGFRSVECFWRWMNFGAWVAVR